MPAARPLSLEQFVALNEEMAALVRAGVPLDRGLTDLGRDLPGRLGVMASALGKRMEAGEPLEKIVADESQRFPPLFRAVITAGVRSGNLAAALEGLATTTRRVREMRRIVGVAMVYPLFVLVLAVVLFALVADRWAPIVSDAYHHWDVSQSGFIDAVARIGPYAWQWAPWLPLLALFLGGLWWWRSGRAARVQVSGRARTAAWLPTLARLSKAGRMASFAEVLRLLIEHRVPLPEALALAGEASGDRRLEADARRMAQRLQAGGGSSSEQDAPSRLPPLLTWLLTGGAPASQLVSALEHLERAYRHEALRMVNWLSIYLPLVLTAAIGGTVVFVYSLSVLGPVFYLMRAMGQP